MKKPVLAIDIDDVLFPFTSHINTYYNQQTAAGLQLADYTGWDLDTVWGARPGTANRYIEAIFTAEHRHIAPVARAVDSLSELKNRYQLVAVTARDGQFERETRQWLEHHFPDYFDDIVLAGNEFSGKAYRAKSEICLDLRAAFLIDDGPHNITGCAAVGVPGLLFGNYPWNQLPELPPNVVRVADWTAVVGHLTKDLARSTV